MNEKPPLKVLSRSRLYCGLFFVALSFLMPLNAIWIAMTNIPIGLKALLIGIVSIGGPEIAAIAAIAILGKEFFEFLKAKSFTFLKYLQPRGSVSRRRYRVGLLMFFLPLLPWYIIAYCPHWLPDSSSVRRLVCLACDLCFWSSLFVLGGDFWEKLRALFIYDARVVIPVAVQPEASASAKDAVPESQA